MCSTRVAPASRVAPGGRSGGQELSVASFMVMTRLDHMFDFEHLIDYIRTPERLFTEAEGRQMTIIATRQGEAGTTGRRPRPVGVRRTAAGRYAHRRSTPARPAGAPLRHNGTGVLMSRASHRRRPITPATTVLLALLAAGFTVWLGLVAQFGGVVGTSARVPDKLAVVQVESGETLEQIAQRVAPDAPVGQVVDRIKELNELDSAAVDAGQTLIAPIG
jgi:hypothetical protein